MEAQPLVQMGPNVAFNELVARLAAAKFENEVLRHSLIPQLGTDTLGRTMAEFIPYAWMGTLVTSLKAYSDADTNWTAHPLSQAIWQVVNEEIRAKRQGRQSTPTGNPMGQQQQGQLVPAGGGVQFPRGNVLPRNCFKCGQPGHWASNLSSAVPELWFCSSGGVCVCMRVCSEPLYL